MVLAAMFTHLMTILDLPKWFYKALDKKMRGFLWKGHGTANGGCCLVSWNQVQRPLQYGGLGIRNLELQGWALRIRWLWLEKTDASRPWKGLPIVVPRHAQALFNVIVATNVGDGQTTKFWTDRWLQGQTISEIAPHLVGTVPKNAIQNKTVAQALENRTWVRDIKGALSVQIIVEYLQVWDLVDGYTSQQGVQNHHIWRFTQSGT
ncbi:hypothetical protein PR202_ga12483 [Eleusine coracana subsp. coracana]|uniref:Uncharacterized protein n=1 Tax=Eleusine coracana subsp. coracana TaxID=191504 RepID=A0AAV5CCC0_ELECO|nr:hypothetical protein PR202_ga12483 [Eleusine coracana subsp. coracana]